MKKKKKFLRSINLFTVGTIIMISSLAVNSVSISQTMPATYSYNKFGTLYYGLFKPEKYDASKKYPLITFLHGYNDTLTKYLNWYTSESQSKNPCFIITPKSPPSYGDWSGWWTELSKPAKNVLELIDTLATKFCIDKSRLYIYGISLGGEGVFDILDKKPGYFAAAMSLCGGGRPGWAENISKTPFWIFHGSADNVNPPSLSKDVYNEMIRLGAKKVRYQEYAGVGHNVWDYAPFELSWSDWIFNFSKSEVFNEKPNTQIKLECLQGNDNRSFVLQWNDINNKQDRKNKIWYYKIFRNGSLISIANYATLKYVDINPGTDANSYTVLAVNYDFIQSDNSNEVKAQLTTGVDTENELPKTFNLLQNYPNPFNPSTVISYQLPVNSKVKLKIYDTLGREVSTLINEFKEAGSYNSQFSILNSKLPSGIYYYTLSAGNYSETKKMLLMK